MSPLASRMFKALQSLTVECVPHSCGGFTTDDIEWRMGHSFTGEAELNSAIEELTRAKLIHYAGYDEEDALHHCYELIA